MAWARNFFEKLGDDGLKAFYLPRLVAGLGVSEAELRQALGAAPARGQGAAREARRLVAVRPVGKDDKDDRYFLRFPIQYPEYVQDLADRGFERVLVTDWARKLWEKIKMYSGQDILPWLDDEENALLGALPPGAGGAHSFGRGPEGGMAAHLRQDIGGAREAGPPPAQTGLVRGPAGRGRAPGRRIFAGPERVPREGR
jgi:hypothetical protein